MLAIKVINATLHLSQKFAHTNKLDGLFFSMEDFADKFSRRITVFMCVPW